MCCVVGILMTLARGMLPMQEVPNHIMGSSQNLWENFCELPCKLFSSSHRTLFQADSDEKCQHFSETITLLSVLLSHVFDFYIDSSVSLMVDAYLPGIFEKPLSPFYTAS